ncbi:LLM class flavin-dependent oxidoreductase [Conexibacter sp. JD483]|uniref:LLM class flavin-dependent oxidoreductase n=1 Tax=unclassified Conexibacter TaxID=2627773 RepID=UPI00271A829A|nr:MULTISPECIES: LLM class flavin-dependent oxidoreductase [unclassified Conexibacter]MDO8186522.1 LLM class flavin-dependent oxidoreductase [Conexibacter sp. CPCC 205706]MDO8200091.1 LLM class flavin-dependent oxidoreductase [Conexibacter sp. CPCC 205762]MDR9372189.1 LLM class flavin-dependent oxidoreductase [Conexibacter sp. JD483]
MIAPSADATTGPAPVRWGVNLPLPAHSLPDHRAVVERLADAGFDDVWTGEGLGDDGITPLAATAAWAPELRLCTGVLPVYTRGPAVIAQTAYTLAQLARGGVLLGIGSSIPAFVHGANGVAFEEPYKRVRDTLRHVRGALRGELVEGPAPTIPFERFQLPRAAPTAKVILGALRPGMLKLAFTEADGAITNILCAEDLPPVIDSIDAPLAGRELVVKVFCCPSEDADHVDRAGREFVTYMLNMPTYRGFHQWLGRGEELAEMNARWDDGDLAGARRALPVQVRDGLFVHGSPHAIREQVRRFLHPAVTAVNLFVFSGPELERRPDTLVDVLAALRPR